MGPGLQFSVSPNSKSLTFRIYGKLEFQCTRNGTQNHPFCPGPIQDTFIIFLDISPPDFPTIFKNNQKTNIGNMEI